jgi:molecular chaperone GrpE (heat shock protein)
MSKLFKFASHVLGGYGDKFGREIARAIQTEQKQAIKEIYIEERKEYADQVRQKFGILCHAGKIKKEQLKMVRSLLESILGGYAVEYKDMRFDNEFHRIYTMLKSYHLDNNDCEEIMSALDQIQHSS